MPTFLRGRSGLIFLGLIVLCGLLAGPWRNQWGWRADLASELRLHDGVILFYGKVVDQEEQPVANATINYSTSRPGEFFPSLGLPLGTKGKVTSDATGFFQISGLNGQSMSINGVEKEGYLASERNPRTFGYTGGPGRAHDPDKRNPVIYLMIKAAGHQKIKPMEEKIWISWNKVPTAYPLPDGNVLLIEGTRTRLPEQRQGFPWKVKVTLKEGGLKKQLELESALAPTDGYQPFLELPDAPNTIGSDTRIFLKTKANRYGKINFILKHYYEDDKASGIFELYYNPTGGRVTE